MDGVPTHVHFVGLRVRRGMRSAVRVLAPSCIVGQGSRLAARRTLSFEGCVRKNLCSGTPRIHHAFSLVSPS